MIAVMAVVALTASAQQQLNLSTYGGTNVEPFDGKACNVTVSRALFHGWNTIALPFAVTESELNEAYGSDCRLEKLVGVERNGNQLTLSFQDCKEQGIEANVPYILYYGGENANRRITKEAIIYNNEPSISFNVKGSGETVTMAGAQRHFDGKGCYGVLAKDNNDAKFVKVDDINSSGFYATRCFIKVSTGNDIILNTVHLAKGEATSITSVAAANEKVDVYNLSGQRVATKVRATDINNMQPGVYVVKGQKVLVK